MDHFHYKIPGWFSFPKLYSQMVDTYQNAHFVEIGAWQGCSTAYMAVEIINSNKNIKFDVYDIWGRFSIAGLNTKSPNLLPDNTVEQLFLKNIEPVKHILNAQKLDSVSAAHNYENNSLDFIFIDANHAYDAVLADIKAWYPKLKSGGHIAGHDYWNDEGVRNAVKYYFNSQDDRYYYGEECWCVYKM